MTIGGKAPLDPLGRTSYNHESTAGPVKQKPQEKITNVAKFFFKQIGNSISRVQGKASMVATNAEMALKTFSEGSAKICKLYFTYKAMSNNEHAVKLAKSKQKATVEVDKKFKKEQKNLKNDVGKVFERAKKLCEKHDKGVDSKQEAKLLQETYSLTNRIKELKEKINNLKNNVASHTLNPEANKKHAEELESNLKGIQSVVNSRFKDLMKGAESNDVVETFDELDEQEAEESQTKETPVATKADNKITTESNKILKELRGIVDLLKEKVGKFQKDAAAQYMDEKVKNRLEARYENLNAVLLELIAKDSDLGNVITALDSVQSKDLREPIKKEAMGLFAEMGKLLENLHKVNI